MKKVKIDFIAGSEPKNLYSNSVAMFSWLGIPTKNVFPQATRWHTCRETFVSELRKQPFALNTKKPDYGCNITTSRMRLAVIRKYPHGSKTTDFNKRNAYDFKWMKHAKRILNLFERYLGWGLSTLSYCNNEELVGAKSRANVFMFSGSAKWMRAPQLMSLYLLIIRLSKHDYFQTLKSLDDMEAFNKLMQRERDNNVLYWKNVRPHLFLILDNINELFFYRPIKEAYREQNGTHGINELILGNADTSTISRFNELKKRKGGGDGSTK